MLSGRDTLLQIERTLRSVRDESDRLGREVKSTAEQLSRNRQQQSATTKQLAQLRLSELERGELFSSLDSADQRAQQAISERSQAYDSLEAKLADARRSLETLEAQRKLVHEDVDHAAQRLANGEAKVQRALDENPAFQEQLQKVRDAVQVAQAAQAKTQTAEQDRREKGQPFEADILFNYLWQRNYGTSEYKAGLISRWLDGWVAGIISYQQARPTYFNLLEIPRRLREHAERRQIESDNELEQLREQEARATSLGGVPALLDQLRTAEKRQDEIDAEIERSESALNELQEQRVAFGSGNDLFMQKGLAILAEALQRKDANELIERARATYDPRDDNLVDELLELREIDDMLEDELNDHRQTQSHQIKRLKELEEVRRRFKRKRFDDLRSGFSDDDAIEAILNQFLRGLVGGSELWRVLKRLQRHRDVGAWPDFGSGGFGSKRSRGRRSTWHWPGNSGGWRLPRGGGSRSRGGSFGRGGLRTRGGFRTGGGFGGRSRGGGSRGGGFKTGGGF